MNIQENSTLQEDNNTSLDKDSRLVNSIKNQVDLTGYDVEVLMNIYNHVFVKNDCGLMILEDAFLERNYGLVSSCEALYESVGRNVYADNMMTLLGVCGFSRKDIIYHNVFLMIEEHDNEFIDTDTFREALMCLMDYNNITREELNYAFQGKERGIQFEETDGKSMAFWFLDNIPVSDNV